MGIRKEESKAREERVGSSYMLYLWDHMGSWYGDEEGLRWR